MWRLSKLIFPRCPRKYTFVGSPARFRGPGNEISASYVLTQSFNGEPMKVHCVPGYAEALYLVEYPERSQFLLLDCGCPSDYTRVKFYIENVLSEGNKVPYTLRNNLRLAVSTHCHLDHCGAAMGYLEEQVPLVRPTHMSTSYQGLRRRIHQWIECFIVIFVAARLGRLPENPFWYAEGLAGPYYPMPPALRKLKHGDALPFGFDDWVAVKVPGHTTHMVALYHTPSGILYAADLLVKLKKGFFPPKPVDYDWAYNSTIHRLRKLDVRYLLLAHGGIVDVEDQRGSWGSVLDDVVSSFQYEMRHPIASREKDATLSTRVMELITKLLRSVPVEARNFSRADLDTGAMPQLAPEPASVIILDR